MLLIHRILYVYIYMEMFSWIILSYSTMIRLKGIIPLFVVSIQNRLFLYVSVLSKIYIIHGVMYTTQCNVHCTVYNEQWQLRIQQTHIFINFHKWKGFKKIIYM